MLLIVIVILIELGKSGLVSVT